MNKKKKNEYNENINYIRYRFRGAIDPGSDRDNKVPSTSKASFLLKNIKTECKINTEKILRDCPANLEYDGPNRYQHFEKIAYRAGGLWEKIIERGIENYISIKPEGEDESLKEDIENLYTLLKKTKRSNSSFELSEPMDYLEQRINEINIKLAEKEKKERYSGMASGVFNMGLGVLLAVMGVDFHYDPLIYAGQFITMYGVVKALMSFTSKANEE